MNEFRVDINREVAPVKIVKGIEVAQSSGLCYVDCYFPDGTQATYGYIGVNPVPGDTFAPLAYCTQAISDLIQDAINKQLGCVDGPAAPVIVEYVGNEFEQEEDEDDDDD